MRCALLVAVPLFAAALVVPRAYAGSPHFVSCAISSQSASQICVEGKEAGLGDEDQITVTLAVTAHCQNPGGNKPQAANKETFETGADVPVQNGKALYDLCVSPTFSPACVPPMTLVVDAIVVTDEDNGLSCTLRTLQ
jgi:hypothetical protein